MPGDSGACGTSRDVQDRGRDRRHARSVPACLPPVAAVTLANAKEVVDVVVAAMSNLRSRVGWRRGELTLAAKVLLLQLVVIAVLLAAVGVLSVRQSNADFAEEQGAQMRSVAEYVATLPEVRGQLDVCEDGRAPARRPPRGLAPYVDRGVSLSSASDVMVVSPDGRRAGGDRPEPGRRTGRPRRERRARGSGMDRRRRARRRAGGRRTRARSSPRTAPCSGSSPPRRPTRRWPTRSRPPLPDLALFLGLGALLGLAAPGWCPAWCAARPAAWAPPSWPTSPTSARRSCTRSGRASSASAPTAGSR